MTALATSPTPVLPGPHPIDSTVSHWMTTACKRVASDQKYRGDVDELVADAYIACRARYHSYQPHRGSLSKWVYAVSRQAANTFVMKARGYRQTSSRVNGVPKTRWVARNVANFTDAGLDPRGENPEGGPEYDSI